MDPLLSVITPASNHVRLLPPELVDVDWRSREADIPYEIVVLSDGSTDPTVHIADCFTDSIQNLPIKDL
jgi:glycosyltransferase involved in cell wall biosynthesis